MKRNRSGIVLVLSAVCLVCACAPRHPPATAAAEETSKTLTRPQTGGGTATTTGHSEPPPSTPGTGEPGASGCPRGCERPPAGCTIKGNINIKTGDRVYHVPGQLHYNDVTIEPERGEFWFCTEDEAQANGWKRAKR
jgi:hypothetical protein